MNEEQWLAQSKAGDPVAFQQLLIPHMSFLSRYLNKNLPKYAQRILDSEDILQEVFLSAFREIEQFEPRSPGSLRAWLRAIAQHCLQDKLRYLNRAKRGRSFRQIKLAVTQSGVIDDVLNHLPAECRSPSSSAANHEAVSAIHTAILDLPKSYQTAVELRIFQGKSLEEVAQIMGSTPRAIQGLIDRSKSKMRMALEDQMFG